MHSFKPLFSAFALALLAGALVFAQQKPSPLALDKDGEKWVQATLKKMTLDEKVGQLLVPSVGSNYMSTDSTSFDELVKAVHELHIGGFHLFGGSERAPNVRGHDDPALGAEAKANQRGIICDGHGNMPHHGFVWHSLLCLTTFR